MQLLILETSLKGSQLKIPSISWIHKGGIVLFQQHLSSYFLNIQDASGKNRSKVQGAKKKTRLESQYNTYNTSLCPPLCSGNPSGINTIHALLFGIHKVDGMLWNMALNHKAVRNPN